MAMLAERKNKVKWSLNPRGKAWSQDSNKFGQKMLEKMGWQQGKGLGPDGKGITEHVKVSYKNDSKGMGYKESNDQWTEHADHFANLLESLSGATEKPDEVKLNSLEKKSETSKARVHYHKFTRGKDLSKYSEKDLANIFGRKTLKESNKEMQEEKSDSNKIKSMYDSNLLNSGSMRDYFKKKLPTFGKSNGFVVGKNGVLKKEDSESESEARPSFGFGYKPKDDTEHSNNYDGDTKISYENTPEKDNCKTKSKEVAKSSFVSYLDVEETNSNKKKKKKRKGEEVEEHSVLSPKKKSKTSDEETRTKKSKEEVEENVGISNPAFNPLRTPIKVQRHVLNTIQESVSENSMLEENSPKTIETRAEVYINAPKEGYEPEEQGEMSKTKKKIQNIEQITEVYNGEERKSKKKKKNVGESINVIVDDIENIPKKKQTIHSIESEENSYELKNKKKKKDGKIVVDNPNFVDTCESLNISSTEENPDKVKIKKLKKKDKQSALQNPNFNTTTENFVDSQLEVKVKEKKKKKNVKEDKFAVDNPSFNESMENSTDSLRVADNPYEVKVKEKKKKAKDVFALSNPSFNDSAENSTDSARIGENPYEVKAKNKKKKKVKAEKFALGNPSFNESAENSTDFSLIEENPYEVKIKDKKKRKVKEEKFALDNPSFRESAEISTDSSRNGENTNEGMEEKKKKKINDVFALSNPSFNESDENSTEFLQNGENPYEVKVKKKEKKVKEDKFAVGIFSSNKSVENSTDSSRVEQNSYDVEVKKKSKKKKQDVETSIDCTQISETSYEKRNKKREKKEAFAIDNPDFNPNDSVEVETKNNALEVERKKKKPKKIKEEGGIVNPALNLDNSQSEIKEVDSVEILESDIMLNVVSTPIVNKSKPQNENTYSITKVNSVKRTKSVRFSDVTQERIIPNNEELRNLDESEMLSAEITNGYSNGTGTSPMDENQSRKSKKRKLGLDNAAFDKQRNTIDENLDSISKTIDRYQAEIENDINEKKLETFQMDDIMVGEVGNPHGENERVSDGSMLRFKYAHFKQATPFYQLNKTGAKKSYKHLIKGDVVIKFKDSNLHEIAGYAVKTKSTT